MDLQKEKIAHEKHLLSQGVDFKYLPNIQYNELENVYELIEWDEEYSEALNEINSSWCTWQAAKAQAVLEVKPSRCVTLTCAQLREAFMFGAPDKDDQEQLETEMTISWSENGHSGKGYYCYYSDLPEEGAIFLDDVIEAQEQANESK